MKLDIRAAFAAALLSCVCATSALATGAIAVNDEAGTSAEDAGYAVGYGGNKKEASASAMKECKAAGNESCEVVLTFEQCGAYVGNKAYYATGIGSTEAAAEGCAGGMPDLQAHRFRLPLRHRLP